MSATISGKVWVIPNFTDIQPLDSLVQHCRSDAAVRILFARRFTEYRGTRIMAEAAKRLLASGRNLEFTFAGEGPDAEWLKATFAGERRVNFIKFEARAAIEVNLAHDIAVVPSLGSEGTSLSVIEAMGSGRAVVATSIGGITNLIIDGFNGVLINPDAESLFRALNSLIADEPRRRQLGRAAYETAQRALGLPRWKTAWADVLKTLSLTLD